jgi:hypothetical protein
VAHKNPGLAPDAFHFQIKYAGVGIDPAVNLSRGKQFFNFIVAVSHETFSKSFFIPPGLFLNIPWNDVRSK